MESQCKTFFTTGKTEISHKVAERLALYLGSDNEERMNYFKLTKKAYAVRSSYIHGQNLQKKLEIKNLSDLSNDMDQLIRKLMSKIIMLDSEIFLKNETILNSYFDNLILSK